MAKLKFQNVTGMPDILPRDMRFFDVIKNTASKIASYYGYESIETPTVELSELFEKGTGLSTDIVQKQMYNFKSEGGDSLTLRPEFTPSIVRAYIQHGMASWPQPVKLSTSGRLFRHERPQSGRYREFRQFEIDVIGESDPALDAQIIFVLYKILQTIGLKELNVQVNSIGCGKCKPVYKRVLRDYYKGKERSLCKDCRGRVKTNLLRLLDCKDEKCERLQVGAPEIIDNLCSECHNHLKHVLEILDEIEVPYMLSPHLVRGLDYYTKTVFEIFPQASEVKASAEKDEANEIVDDDPKEEDTKDIVGKEDPATRVSAIAGGGRFDELVNLLGGEDVPAVGGSIGLERTAMLMKGLGTKLPKEKAPKVFFVHLGDLAKKKGVKLMEEFRGAGILVRESLGKSSIRAQMAVADKLEVEYALILGHQEVAEETIIIRDMKSGSQEVVPIGKVINEIKKRIK